MNSAEIKLDIFRQIDTLQEDMLIELQSILLNYLNKNKIQVPIKKRQFGCLKGLIINMSEDFDKPLDDFKDYM